jgi:hypothetical protein
MAIHEAASVAEKKTGRNPDDWKIKPIVIQMRGSLEFKATVERLAEFDGTNVAAMVDRAIRRYAREIEFPDPLPKR